MSHIGRYRTKITSANPEFVTNAMKLLSEALGMNLTFEKYRNRYGRTLQSEFGILKNVADGFMVNIKKDGSLEIVGDSWRDQKLFNEAKELLELYYYAVASNYALEQRKMSVTVDLSQVREKKKIILVGSR